jgi:hypothetical protein
VVALASLLALAFGGVNAHAQPAKENPDQCDVRFRG